MQEIQILISFTLYIHVCINRYFRDMCICRFLFPFLLSWLSFHIHGRGNRQTNRGEHTRIPLSPLGLPSHSFLLFTIQQYTLCKFKTNSWQGLFMTQFLKGIFRKTRIGWLVGWLEVREPSGGSHEPCLLKDSSQLKHGVSFLLSNSVQGLNIKQVFCIRGLHRTFPFNCALDWAPRHTIRQGSLRLDLPWSQGI